MPDQDTTAKPTSSSLLRSSARTGEGGAESHREGARPRRAGATEPTDAPGDKMDSDEMVRKIADKVYAMLLDDLAIERERQRPSSRMVGRQGGY